MVTGMIFFLNTQEGIIKTKKIILATVLTGIMDRKGVTKAAQVQIKKTRADS